MITASWITLFAPLAGAVAITLAGTRISRKAAAWLSTASVGVAFAAAAVAFVAMLGEDEEERSHVSTAWTWLTAGDFEFGLSILVDPLSMTMMLIVSGVGGLIVLYSIGYMDGDDEERRYFAYMALFVFSMLLLVQAGNFLILLAGWGLVGLASYLLIGFWHERESAVAAAKKAFVMNAFGDATMALAFFVLVWQTGTLAFPEVFEASGELSSTAISLVALGLLGGAVAKSAQIPLHTWLPDAMEGPTPVSALIHAATMVTAGVYFIARAHEVFELAPFVHGLSAGLGAATLLVAGLVALVQTDIKRVIAYSTMSQIGYMFVGVGVGAYANGMFHLMTHAFFKALLFMAAGVVIHYLAGEQDMRRMGGLGRLLPFTRIAFLVGALALAGVPPFSGFFSKDAILASTLAVGGWSYLLFAAGLIGAFFTGVYTFRMYFMTFGGEGPKAEAHHGHGEGPRTMLVPVAILTVLATVGGGLQIAGVWHPVSDFLHAAAEPTVEPTVAQDWLTSLFAVAAGALGIWLAWATYARRTRPVPSWAGIRRTLEHKLWFDELYDAVFYRPGAWLARALRGGVEEPVIGGSIAGVSATALGAGGGLSEAQTGYLREYALAIAVGVALLTLVFLVAR